jgi:membrane associated rhomboid family serine protease
MPTCYRHQTRETGVSCSNCGRPICPDCMTPTSVGMRCPECASQKTKVRRVAKTPIGGLTTQRPVATYTIIAINIVAFLAELTTGSGGFSGAQSGTVFDKGALFGPLVHVNHEYWRLVTSGFLHANFLHIALNMWFIYAIGSTLEPALGRVRYVALYFTALLCGSFGVLLLQPDSVAIGASGAAFGLLGALIVEARSRGIDLWQSGLLLTALINFVFTFTVSGISIGAHVGGFLGGVLIGVIFDQADRRRLPQAVAVGACVVIAAAAVIGGIALAGNSNLIGSTRF